VGTSLYAAGGPCCSRNRSRSSAHRSAADFEKRDARFRSRYCEPIAVSFEANAASVYELLEFDRFILDFLVGGLQDLADSLLEQGRHTAATTVSNRVAALRNIRSSDSLRPRYETIFNQCVVLLVSYFGSALHSLFLEGVSASLRSGRSIPAAGQDVKIAWRELNSKEDALEVVFAELLIAQKDISFHDMQSITRAFKEHLALDLGRSGQTNDIIVGQAARHVIVHAGGNVDARMLRQLSNVRPRRLKTALQLGERIQFNTEEVRLLGATMSEYVGRLAVQLTEETRS
jgi:hypothetical protein